MERTELLHEELTAKIRDAFYHVYNSMGPGFAEKVYENALALTLRKQGFEVRQRIHIKVYFEGEVVGTYEADVMVNDVVIIEAKTVSKLISEHEAQLFNYLHATEIEVGLLLNFGPRPEYKRRVVSNANKRHLSGMLN